MIKIFKGDLVNNETDREAGSLFSQDDMVLFATRDNSVCLRVLEFQIEGKNIAKEEVLKHSLKDP